MNNHHATHKSILHLSFLLGIHFSPISHKILNPRQSNEARAQRAKAYLKKDLVLCMDVKKLAPREPSFFCVDQVEPPTSSRAKEQLADQQKLDDGKKIGDRKKVCF